jgi:hypothetical protein
LNLLQTHEGILEARRLPCKLTGVAVTKTLSNFQPIGALALETAEKKYAEVGGF